MIIKIDEKKLIEQMNEVYKNIELLYAEYQIKQTDTLQCIINEQFSKLDALKTMLTLNGYKFEYKYNSYYIY